ncbi:hypothetical protein TCAL_00026 [Tigriopus californicus]|uniref:PNPLA domain-containing protein n=1 Tax=Tigriopus californicus TaxID=6832 RepID=A0A553PHB2_TIGCA|nr:patanin-like phospholipase domain-containing protein atgl-1 [Tigriopus californicus]TRY77072.1 hypothetical protein TCAL_00026 [Tigriopus californicus]|eukprot:TCALIF_00026-PA protein Name:"Similar to C05D11.7 Uncharacterized protein C05D11.7 (Caenorhabditis elegans)" AED:0.02 eAED:0.02 QI:0/-1/0/1/-1/1/1/0/289
MAIPKISVSFSGCGFLGLYHVGALACFNDYKHKVHIEHALGASAGALVALAAIVDIPTEILKKRFTQIVKDANSLPFGAFNPKFNVTKLFQDELGAQLPEDAHERVSARLTVSLTDLSMQNKLVSNFETRKDLIDAVICSCYLPAFSGYEIPNYKNQSFLDGGFTNNQPTLSDKTLRVSPFASRSHICPVDEPAAYANIISTSRIGPEEVEVSTMNVKRLLKTFLPAEDLEILYQEGYDNTKAYLESASIKNHFISNSVKSEDDRANGSSCPQNNGTAPNSHSSSTPSS